MRRKEFNRHLSILVANAHCESSSLHASGVRQQAASVEQSRTRLI
jgi:hypothetical protein